MLRDEQYNIVALMDAGNSTIVERIRYDSFGKPTFITEATGTEHDRSQFGLEYAFQGRRWDWESDLYHFRTRAYDPSTNRFLQRDSIGIWGDPMNMGNGYTFVGSNPWSFVDPFGLTTQKEKKYAKGGRNSMLNESGFAFEYLFESCPTPISSQSIFSPGPDPRGSLIGKIWTLPNTALAACRTLSTHFASIRATFFDWILS